MTHILEEFFRFLQGSPTVFHAAKEIANRLAEADFIPLDEGEKWYLEPGKGYFFMREEALVAAFRIPKSAPTHARILATHLDSPALKIKPHPDIRSHEMGQLGTEVYGAPLLHTWLDRDLAISGKLVVLNAAGKLETLLVHLDDAPVIIPGLALHLDRSVMEKGILVHKQDHLKPILTLKTEDKLLETQLRKRHNFKKLLSYDLFLTPLQAPSFLGFDSELIAAYRLDNLTSAFAALYAIASAKPRSDALQISLFWDHEEIGSLSPLGADSSFANQLLERIGAAFKMDREDFFRLKAKSLCLSADVCHGYHPNFGDKYDPQNAPYLGKGVVVKYNANQKYATSSSSAASLIELAEKMKVPLQLSASRSDIPSGSTVGPFMGAHLGMPTLDLGIACWAMHSARETIAAQDEVLLCKLLKAALEEPLVMV